MAKQRFEMTEAQRVRLLEASESIPLVALNAGMPTSPQARANIAWRALADELGFVWDTVESVPGCPQMIFNAEPIEVPTASQDISRT